MLAARSGNCTATVFNIQPTKIVKAGMESLGKGSCLAWSKDGRLMARVSDKSVIVAHALRGFDDVATAKRPNTVRAICFCLSTLRNDNMAVVGDDGHLCVYQVVSSAEEYYLELIFDQFLDKDLRSVAWSPGKYQNNTFSIPFYWPQANDEYFEFFTSQFRWKFNCLWWKREICSLY